jgi:hypothetical protein
MDYLEINKVDKRCPVCFSRENDVLLLNDGQGHYWCTHCSFTGSAAEIHGAYADLSKRFHGILRRVTLEDQLKM